MSLHRTRKHRRQRKQALRHGKAAKPRHTRLGGRTGSSQRRTRGKAPYQPRPRVARPRSPTEGGLHDLGWSEYRWAETLGWPENGHDAPDY